MLSTFWCDEAARPARVGLVRLVTYRGVGHCLFVLEPSILTCLTFFRFGRAGLQLRKVSGARCLLTSRLLNKQRAPLTFHNRKPAPPKLKLLRQPGGYKYTLVSPLHVAFTSPPTMSFGALPAELDNHILAFLDHHALNSMSKTSRTYRKVTEPFLYRHNKLTAEHNISIRWLVVTLLSRSELAAHIKSITFVEKDRLPDRDAWSIRMLCHPSELLEQAISAVHKAIVEVFGSAPELADVRMQWMGAILGRDYLEGCLTLSVCLAVNLESLTLIDDLTSEDITGCHGRLLTLIMSHVYYRSLSMYRLEASTPVLKVRPLTKLRRLHIETLSPVHIVTLPNLQTLHIQGYEAFLVLPSPDLSPPHGLHTLELIDTYGSPNTTEGILSGTMQ